MRTVEILRISRITGRILLGAGVATLSVGFAAGFSFLAKCLGCVFVGGVVAILVSWVVSAPIRGKRLKITQKNKIWKEYLAIRKERIIVNEDTGEARKIKIIAIKNVKAKYSNKKGYIGLLAKDERDRIYENNFYELEDDSLFNPYATWISKFPNDTCPFWKDIDWGYILPEKRKKLIVEQFPDDLNYCERHKNIYWKDKKCPFCQLEEILKEAHKRTLQKGIETYKVRIKTE